MVWHPPILLVLCLPLFFLLKYLSFGLRSARNPWGGRQNLKLSFVNFFYFFLPGTSFALAFFGRWLFVV
jgi:hypothetical protein